jgi:hypothetical protein
MADRGLTGQHAERINPVRGTLSIESALNAPPSGPSAGRRREDRGSDKGMTAAAKDASFGLFLAEASSLTNSDSEGSPLKSLPSRAQPAQPGHRPSASIDSRMRRNDET